MEPDSFSSFSSQPSSTNDMENNDPSSSWVNDDYQPTTTTTTSTTTTREVEGEGLVSSGSSGPFATDSPASNILYCGFARAGKMIHQCGMVTEFKSLASALAAKADEYILGKTKIYEANGYLWICVSDVPTNLAVMVLVEANRLPNRVSLSFANSVRDLYLFYLGLQSGIPPPSPQQTLIASKDQRLPTSSELLTDSWDGDPAFFQKALIRWVSSFNAEKTLTYSLPSVDRIDFSSIPALFHSTDPIDGNGELPPSYSSFSVLPPPPSSSSSSSSSSTSSGFTRGTEGRTSRGMLDDELYAMDLETGERGGDGMEEEEYKEVLTHQEKQRRRRRRLIALIIAIIVAAIVAAVVYWEIS